MSRCYPPIINTVTSPASNFTQTVTGLKPAGLYVFYRVNGGAWTQAAYPNTVAGLSWSFVISLLNGANSIDVKTTNNTSGTDPDNDSDIVSSGIFLASLTPESYSVWNCFDEFGLLLGLPRIPGEKNADYKARLLDVYTNPASSTYAGLINGISRELGVLPSQVSISLLSNLMDPDSSGNILNSDGNALGTKLVDYADDVYDHNPIFWGNVVADESYWDGVDEFSNGYTYLPHIWDPVASGIYDKWQAGGIGDNDDLWVDGPVEEYNSVIGDYSWYLKIHSGYFYSAYPSGVISQ